MIELRDQDQLEVLTQAAQVLNSATIFYIIELPSGQQVRYEKPFSAAATTSLINIQFQVDAGKLLYVAISTDQILIAGDAVWCQVGVKRNSDGVELTSIPLISGYLNKAQSLWWPGGPNKAVSDGIGQVVEETVTSPGPGANFTFGPSIGEYWVVDALTFRISTDSNVADRHMRLDWVIRGNATLTFQAEAVVQADETITVTFLREGGSEYGNDIAIQSVLPDIYVNEGSNLNSDIANLQSGDVIANIVAVVRKFPVNR